MKYDEDFLDIKYTLINIFLLKLKPNILDISYTIESNKINIQIVLLENTILDSLYLKEVTNKLMSFTINLNTIFISKIEYNSNKGNWVPEGYKWLSNVILSKSEI